MSEHSIHSILKESFSKSTKEDWHRIALLELNEKYSIENLTWKSGNLNFSPYYDHRDLIDRSYLKENDNPSHRRLPLDIEGWQNLTRITVTDERKANTAALQSLAIGTEGVLFDISSYSDVNIDMLLEKINWAYCNISFVTSAEDKNISSKISSYVEQQHYDPLAIKGAIFWQQFPESIDKRMHGLFNLKKFQPLGFVIYPSLPVDEISKSLLYGVMSMEHLTNLGIEKDLAFQSITISLPSDENFFVTIAKCKALRLLWFQLSQAYKITHYHLHHFQLHGRSEKWRYEKLQPHANMLKNTCDALAFVLGEGNALTICPEEEDNAAMQRATLHVSNILREESQLDKVTDVVAGAYTLENMIREFSQAAWKDFQNKVSDL